MRENKMKIGYTEYNNRKEPVGGLVSGSKIRRIALKYAPFIVGPMLLLGCGKNETKQPKEKPPVVTTIKNEKMGEAKQVENREEVAIKRMVEDRVNRITGLLKVLGAKEGDFSKLNEEKVKGIVDGIKYIINAQRFALEKETTFEAVYNYSVDYTDIAIVTALYDNGSSSETKQAIAELLGLSLYEQNAINYTQYAGFYALVSAHLPENFSELFNLVADVKNGRYAGTKVALPVLISSDSIATILPPILVMAKPEERAVKADRLVTVLLDILKDEGVSKEELVRLKALSGSIVESVVKNKKEEFYEGVVAGLFDASSNETKKILSLIYGIILQRVNKLSDKELAIYYTILDGKPLQTFADVKKTVIKATKFVESNVVLKKPRERNNHKQSEVEDESKKPSVDPENPYNDEVPSNPYE